MYFVSDLDAYNLANEYSDFWRTLTWYRMYCHSQLGENKSEYVKGLDSLKGAFLELSEHDDVSKYIKEPVTTLIERIESRLERKQFTREDVAYITNLLWEFENEREEFTHKYLEAYLRQSAEDNLPKGMSSILQLLEGDNHNSAIVDSFKYLDWLLQEFLSVSPHEYYGETLVNLAFSPGDGKIKLGTNENEQRGLRNLASGLYALFRNPAAHRNMFDETSGIIHFDGAEQSAATITVMVSLLAKLVYETVFRRLDPQIQEELTIFAQKYSWNQDIIKLAWRNKYSWGIGLPADSTKFLKECQLVVTLAEDKHGPHLYITLRGDLEKDDIEELIQNIHQISNLRVVFHTT